MVAKKKISKNKINYYPKEVRAAINAAIAEGGMTLDELVAHINNEHGERIKSAGKTVPSRSGLDRYTDDFHADMEESIQDARELRQFSEAFVAHMGETPEGDTGQMLVQMVQSAAAKSISAARKKGVLEVKELAGFATTVQRLSNADASQAKRADLIAKRARELLVAEQKKKLDGAEKSGLISAETLATIRSQIYGL